MPSEAVMARQPGAQLVQRFRKPEPDKSIDVYRINQP
jgi:hypothetical protein